MASRFSLLLAMLALPLAAAAQSPLAEGVEPERIAQGLQFTEGPVWFEGGLLFSDIPANIVYRWTPDAGLSIYRQPSQKSNGLALDADGHLLLAQHQARRVARLVDGAESPVATQYDGKTFNSPNDMALHSDGSLYFTDPTWGLEGRPAELGFTGVYCLAPDGTVSLLVDSLYQPNGIVFSPDEGTLYVSTSDERTVVAYDVAGHALSNGRLFARLSGSGAADGMEVDAAGNLWVTGPRGVHIYAPDGTPLDVVDVPGQTTNVAWGDADGLTLYITSGPGVYRLRIGTATANESMTPIGALRIDSVWPNPASDTARVSYRLGQRGPAVVTLTDLLGRELRRFDAGARASGAHTLALDLSGLPAARYLVRLTTHRGSVTQPVTVVR